MSVARTPFYLNYAAKVHFLHHLEEVLTNFWYHSSNYFEKVFIARSLRMLQSLANLRARLRGYPQDTEVAKLAKKSNRGIRTLHGIQESSSRKYPKRKSYQLPTDYYVPRFSWRPRNTINYKV